jgi:hypothetical protein
VQDLQKWLCVGYISGEKLIREGTRFLLAHQNRDGSWGDVDDDVYNRYHSTETAVKGLCDYAARSEGLSFLEVEPLLKRWAGANAVDGAGRRLVLFLRL